jgi:hypothetical protein
MTDYAFMKSGFDNIDNGDDEEKAKDFMSILVHFSENALNHSALYIKHCKRNCITPEDIKRGMMLEMFMFTKRDNLKEKIEAIKDEIYGDDEDETIVINEPDRKEDAFKESNCECAMCLCMTNVYKRWAKWSPETPVQEILQRHIENIN